MKKRALFFSVIVTLAFSAPVHAAEAWRDGYVTRLMSIMMSDPSYTDIVMTDLDSNGIPEAFVIKPGANGGIGGGITMRNNSVTPIQTPGNVIGMCLTDITVYEDDNGQNYFVGKEVGRYTNTIQYYQLNFDGTKLSCVPVVKNSYSTYCALPYRDVYSSDFLKNGFPDRAKIRDFMDSYTVQTHISVKPSTAGVSVNGKYVDVSGFNINYSNYYKIRDIAMVLRTTSGRFNVGWDSALNAVAIDTGVKYVIAGGELSGIESDDILSIVPSESPILVDGEEVSMEAYNINGNNYFQIRELGDILGFEVGWDEESQTVLITTN